MQTFLPFDDFKKCAQILDWQRLGKQRVEGMQILQCLETPNRWKNHPAVKMWEGYEKTLMWYVDEMIEEWVRRGYNNTMKRYREYYEYGWDCERPFWLGDERVHSSHRANLINKKPEHYNQFGWAEEPIQGYWWPLRKNNGEWVCQYCKGAYVECPTQIKKQEQITCWMQLNV